MSIFKKGEKNIKKGLHFCEEYYIIPLVASEKRIAKENLGLSPNGKATDSDSVISRFESL